MSIITDERFQDLYRHAKEGDTQKLKECLDVLTSDQSDQEYFTHCFNLALCQSAQNGHSECIKLLIAVSNPKELGSLALIKAAIEGHAECVKLLIPVCDPLLRESHALMSAAAKGSLECVQLLLPYTHAQNEINYALHMAVCEQRQDVFDVLYPLSDIEWVRDNIKKGFDYKPKDTEHRLLFIDTCIAHYEKQLINKHIDEPSSTRPTKKM